MNYILLYILVGFLAIALSYGMHLVILLSFYKVCGKEFTIISYFIPLMITLFLIALYFISKKIARILFRISYIFIGIYTGLLIQMFFVSCIILIVNAIVHIPIFIGIPILVALPIIICLYGALNQYYFKTEYVQLNYTSNSNNNNDENQPYKTTKKICHLSDIHLGPIYQEHTTKRIVQEIFKINPDIVVITGDITDGSDKIDKEWLEPFNTISVPILYIAGNHELIYGKSDILNLIAQTNIQYIYNNIYYYENSINFIGVDYEYDLKKKIIEIQEQNTNKDKINILLNHVPSLLPDELEKYDIFLMLSGHTHGGQIFPFNIFVYLMNKCFSGLYSSKNNKHHVYVSSGVGGYLIPMRIMSFSKISVIEISY